MDSHRLSSSVARVRAVVPEVFGLERVDLLADDWEQCALLTIGEVRDDGSVDVLLMLEGSREAP